MSSRGPSGPPSGPQSGSPPVSDGDSWGTGSDAEQTFWDDVTLELATQTGQVTEEVKELLSTQATRFTFETLLSANNGVAMIIRERLDNGQERKFVLKAAAGIGSEHSIRNEAAWLHRLRYAAHVSTPIYLSNDPLTPLKVPYFLAEYVAHGTLRQFQERAMRANQIIPNRIMWSIFACLIRSCIAMAYHPPGPHIQLEDTQVGEPSSLAHNDMHGDNFVFGMLERTRLLSMGGTMYLHEHALLPPLKLIDFGQSSDSMTAYPTEVNEQLLPEYDDLLGLANYRPETGRRNQGIDQNLLDIGLVMIRLSNARTRVTLEEARLWIRHPGIRPDLDPDLRLLIQRCLAVDPLNRPRLEELNMIINNGYFGKTADHYGEAGQGNGLESDETLRRIVSAYILDADTS
ncbi:uncharacterized protein F4807DRAFT_467595 [Annulohypoxylon truncatum]|uniref:uncharacterized protein n=1 Tax=Annulohypoxylon truncatum TaxID=327061 RepID=UPI002007940A|nr:uncharacterized protein F4807DRAFT_467595 [Annulohypoxylon truncatum]KAI1209702.1 hypothetical protein F4807DRAFT_467595 [Annulohypoxylon truncatum]